MKPRKTTYVIRAVLYTFLVITVRTESLPPSAVDEHSLKLESTSREVSSPQSQLSSSRSSSSVYDFLRIRTPDYGSLNGETEVTSRPHHFINASPTSQPIMFFDDVNSDSHEVRNSMLLIKKRKQRPPQATVFTHGSVMSQDNPSTSSSQLTAVTTSAYAQSQQPLKPKTTPSPLLMYYYHNWNSGSNEEKYYSAGNLNTQNENFGILGSIWRRTTKTPTVINNHHPGSFVKPRPTPPPPKTSQITKQEPQSSAVVWRLPTTKIPSSGVISNHRPGSNGRLPGKKPPNNSGYTIKRPHSGVKNPTYIPQTMPTTTFQQNVKKPTYFSQASSTMAPLQSVKRPIYFSQDFSTMAPHQSVKKPTYFTIALSTTAPQQGVKKLTYFTQALSTTAPQQDVKKPTYFSQALSTTAPQQGVKKPTYSSQTLSATAPQHSVKNPTYSGEASSTTAPNYRVRKPVYFTEASTSVQYTQFTTAVPLNYAEQTESAFSTKKPIPPSITITTQRTHSERFTTGTPKSKTPTQRPSSVKTKGTPPSRVPSTPLQHVKKPVFQEDDPPKVDTIYTTQINNHRPSVMMRRRKPLLNSKIHKPSSHVAIVDKPQQNATDIIGQRLRLPETVRSKWMTVFDAPPGRPTTIKHNKLIVAQRRIDKLPQVTLSPTSNDHVTTTVVVTSQPILALTTKNIKTKTTTSKPTILAQHTITVPDKETFPVAPVIDPWSEIPMPSVPSWAVSSTARPPNFGSPSGSSFFPSFPGFPFMPYFGSLMSPLFNRPLSPSALNTGMQGIKAMQGFLRNSLMGAMFCFLPSALIAMTMSATQRAELRKIPEINSFMIYCKKCLENLEHIQAMNFNKTEPDWVHSL